MMNITRSRMPLSRARTFSAASLVGVGAIALLALTGCGSSSDDGEPEGPQTVDYRAHLVFDAMTKKVTVGLETIVNESGRRLAEPARDVKVDGAKLEKGAVKELDRAEGIAFSKTMNAKAQGAYKLSFVDFQGKTRAVTLHVPTLVAIENTFTRADLSIAEAVLVPYVPVAAKGEIISYELAANGMHNVAGEVKPVRTNFISDCPANACVLGDFDDVLAPGKAALRLFRKKNSVQGKVAVREIYIAAPRAFELK